jgi:hypothetical protein
VEIVLPKFRDVHQALDEDVVERNEDAEGDVTDEMLPANVSPTRSFM